MKSLRRSGILLATLLLLGLPTAARAQCASIAGTGCGPLGTVPNLFCVGSPTVGNASFGFSATLLGSPSFLYVGLCASSPFSISAPGLCPPPSGPCVVGLDPAALFPVYGIGFPMVFFALPIPNDPALVGATVCAQEVGFQSSILFGTCMALSVAVSITVL
jgi:hypothetical protein